jgi:hypothetical protein
MLALAINAARTSILVQDFSSGTIGLGASSTLNARTRLRLIFRNHAWAGTIGTTMMTTSPMNMAE